MLETWRIVWAFIALLSCGINLTCAVLLMTHREIVPHRFTAVLYPTTAAASGIISAIVALNDQFASGRPWSISDVLRVIPISGFLSAGIISLIVLGRYSGQIRVKGFQSEST